MPSSSEGERLDVETTWDLATVRDFLDTGKVNDDGDVEGMEDALSRVIDRNPRLLEDLPITEEQNLPGKRRLTAPPPKKRRDSSGSQPSSQPEGSVS